MSAPIRAASSHDASLLAVLHRASFGPLDAWTADVIGMQLSAPGCFGLLHRSGGMILARIVADEAEILTLAVAPDARRRGIGRCLLDAAMVHARDAGALRLFLEVGVDNQAARRLYAATGFMPVGTRRGYYQDGSDALVMRANLLSTVSC